MRMQTKNDDVWLADGECRLGRGDAALSKKTAGALKSLHH